MKLAGLYAVLPSVSDNTPVLRFDSDKSGGDRAESDRESIAMSEITLDTLTVTGSVDESVGQHGHPAAEMFRRSRNLARIDCMNSVTPATPSGSTPVSNSDTTPFASSVVDTQQLF